MKRFVVPFVSVLMAAGLVAVGWHFGHKRRAIDELYTQPVIDKRIQDAEVAVRLLHDLDNNRIGELRNALQFQLMISVIHLDSLLDLADSRSRELVRNLCKEVATFRKEQLPSFTGRFGNFDDVTMKKLDDILKKVSDEKSK